MSHSRWVNTSRSTKGVYMLGETIGWLLCLSSCVDFAYPAHRCWLSMTLPSQMDLRWSRVPAMPEQSMPPRTLLKPQQPQERVSAVTELYVTITGKGHRRPLIATLLTPWTLSESTIYTARCSRQFGQKPGTNRTLDPPLPPNCNNINFMSEDQANLAWTRHVHARGMGRNQAIFFSILAK